MKTKTEGSKKMKAVDTTPVQLQVLSEAWIPFAERLAQTISKLEEDSFLIVTKKNTNQFVQIVCQGSFGTRLETISNFFRDEANQLTEEQIAKLLQIGWLPPSGDQVYGSPAFVPDGSPNFYYDFPTPVDFAALAAMAVQTFVEILQISHPGFLEYECFDGAGNSISLPDLGLQRANSVSQKEALPQLIIDTITEVTGISDWAFDEDGILGGITCGSATTYIHLLKDEQYVRLCSIIIEGVKESQQLLTRINELNTENGYMHVFVKNGTVVALSDVQVVPFINHHLVNALENFFQVVDGFYDVINAEFGDGASFTVPPTNTTH